MYNGKIIGLFTYTKTGKGTLQGPVVCPRNGYSRDLSPFVCSMKSLHSTTLAINQAREIHRDMNFICRTFFLVVNAQHKL